MRKAAFPLLLAAALAGCTGGAADEAAEPTRVEGTFLPVDDGAGDPAFGTFRDSLRAAVARRDTAALLAAVSPAARLSFGDDAGGPDGFRAMWFAGTPPGDEPVWDILARILDASSVDDGGALTVPYVFGAWPRDSVDAFTHVAVVGENVEARTAPSDTASVAALVSYALLAADEPAAGGFQKVLLPDGRTAFVARGAAMRPVGYRASFWDDGGGYALQTFLTGD